MTLHVADADDPPPQGVLDVIHSSGRFIWYKAPWSKEYGRRGWLGDMTHWAPDGGQAFEAKGTINWYVPSGVPEDAEKEIVKDVAHHIQKAGFADVIKVRKEISKSTDGPVYRIDIEVPEPSEESAPEMQMSNRNAYEVLHNVLDIPYYDGSFDEIDARDLLFRIEAIIDDIDISAGIIEPKDEKREDGPHIIDPGLDKGDIEKRLNHIKHIAQWAIDNGYSKLSAY